MMRKIVETTDLVVGYSYSHRCSRVLGPINISLFEGELVGLIGPNGSGKTTLLRTLSGVQNSLEGGVEICGKEINRYTSPELARKLSVVLTEKVYAGNLSVFALVSLGRYPYTNWIGNLSLADQQQIRWAMEATITTSLADRKIHELSDGELQKVMIARALAQDTDIILLDEPTAHLDLPNRIEIFQLLRRLAKDTRKTILVSTHELDLALQVVDKIWLIDSTVEKVANELSLLVHGTPEDLVLSGIFEKVFKREGIKFDRATGRYNIGFAVKKLVNLSAEGEFFYWTSRAMARAGFKVDNLFLHDWKIKFNPPYFSWTIETNQGEYEVFSIDELLKKLSHLSNLKESLTTRH